MSRPQTTARSDDPGFASPARPEPVRPIARPAVTAPGPMAPIAPVTCLEVRGLARAECLAVLRRLMPGTGSAYDPVPHRSVVFRMRAREVRGRATAAPSA